MDSAVAAAAPEPAAGGSASAPAHGGPLAPAPAPDSQLRAPRLSHSGERLGQGSFADVYRGAYEFTAGAPEPVALKVFRAEGAAALGKAVRAELTIFKQRLRHPQLVEIYGTTSHAELGFVLVMELLPGGSLRQALDDDRISGWKQRLGLLRDVARGMAHLASLRPQPAPRFQTSLQWAPLSAPLLPAPRPPRATAAAPRSRKGPPAAGAASPPGTHL